MKQRWMTVREAARLWRVTPQTVRGWVHGGRVVGQLFSPRCMRVLVSEEEEGVTDGVQGREQEREGEETVGVER